MGTAGTWTLNRHGIDWLNEKLDHCDALERELGECQGRAAGAPAKGFWSSGTGVGIKVAGVSIVIGVALVGGIALGVKVEDAVRAGHP